MAPRGALEPDALAWGQLGGAEEALLARLLLPYPSDAVAQVRVGSMVSRRRAWLPCHPFMVPRHWPRPAAPDPQTSAAWPRGCAPS